MAARKAATLLKLSSSSSSSCRSAAPLIHRRGLAGSADHHGEAKVDFWKHFVIISLTGLGVAIYGGYKHFSGGKKDKKPVEFTQVSCLLCAIVEHERVVVADMRFKC